MGKQGWFVPSNGREWCSRVTFKRFRLYPDRFLVEQDDRGPAEKNLAIVHHVRSSLDRTYG